MCSGRQHIADLWKAVEQLLRPENFLDSFGKTNRSANVSTFWLYNALNYWTNRRIMLNLHNCRNEISFQFWISKLTAWEIKLQRHSSPLPLLTLKRVFVRDMYRIATSMCAGGELNESTLNLARQIFSLNAYLFGDLVGPSSKMMQTPANLFVSLSPKCRKWRVDFAYDDGR